MSEEIDGGVEVPEAGAVVDSAAIAEQERMDNIALGIAISPAPEEVSNAANDEQPAPEPEASPAPVVEPDKSEPDVLDGVVLDETAVQVDAPAPPTVEELQATIAELQGKVKEFESGQKPAAETEADGVGNDAPVDFDSDVEFFQSEEQLDSIMSDPATANGFFNAVRKKTRDEAVVLAHTVIMPQVFAAAGKVMAETLVAQELVQKVFQESPELLEYRQYFRDAYSMVEANNPGLPIERRIAAAAAFTKKKLAAAGKLKESAPKQDAVKPVFPPAPGAGRPQHVSSDYNDFAKAVIF